MGHALAQQLGRAPLLWGRAPELTHYCHVMVPSSMMPAMMGVWQQVPCHGDSWGHCGSRWLRGRRWVSGPEATRGQRLHAGPEATLLGSRDCSPRGTGPPTCGAGPGQVLSHGPQLSQHALAFAAEHWRDAALAGRGPAPAPSAARSNLTPRRAGASPPRHRPQAPHAPRRARCRQCARAAASAAAAALPQAPPRWTRHHWHPLRRHPLRRPSAARQRGAARASAGGRCRCPARRRWPLRRSRRGPGLRAHPRRAGAA
jgi:hypothetical protein